VVAAFVRHATTVILLVLCVVYFGMSSYLSLPRESSPDVQIPVIIVSTPYIGVSPEDVESLVTIPIENELASLTDVKKMNSSSSEGISVIAIEFEPEVDIDTALQKVRDRVNRAKAELPSDAEEPSVSEISFSDIPILLVTLSGGMDEQGLKRLGESLQEELQRLNGVLEVEVTGGREQQVRVQVLPERLAHYGLSLDDVSNAIRGENADIPGGTIQTGAGTFLLRTPGSFDSAADLRAIAVKRVGDRPVFLTDVARIVDEFEDRTTYSRLDGVPSVTLGVKKRTGSNILEVASSVKALVAERSAEWPAGVTYAMTGDQSKDIEIMVAELENSIITALILVVAVLLIFMGVRNSLIVAAAIPLSMLAAFMVLKLLGYTLNMVVLFALIMALGMLVDNAIVVVENIYRHIDEGRSRMDAAIEGTNEVAVAVAASTATTVAAFFPMVFWTGILGQFMGYLPKTIIIVLTASLIVALYVLPAFCARLMARRAGAPVDEVEEDTELHAAVLDREAAELTARLSDARDDTPVDGSMLARVARVVLARQNAQQAKGPLEEPADPIDPATLSPMVRRYVGLLEASIQWRYASFGLGVVTLVLTGVMYSQFGHGVEFFPAVDPDRGFVAVRLPEGADLEATDRVVQMMEDVLAQTENVETFVAQVGVAGDSNPLSGVSEQSNSARITLDFLPTHDKADPGDKVRVEPTPLTMLRLRAAARQIPGATVTVDQEEMGPPVGKPIEVRVSGDDFHVVGQAALALVRELEGVGGITDLEHDYRVGRPELRLRVDRGAAKRVGVSTQQVGAAVRTAIAGSDVSVIRDGEEEIDVLVEVAPEYKRDLQQVLGLRIPGREDTSPNTFPVPISAVASYELVGGAGTISHLDRELIVTIKGDVTEPGTEILMQGVVVNLLEDWDAPAGVYATLGGASDEQAESEAFLSWVFAVAVALILLVMVAQFDSLAIPAMIMVTVVLSLIGVMWGLVLTGTAFGIIMTGIGVISLAGVVVNNAIVLLDYVEQLRTRGMTIHDALIRAGVTRFRPVMLTAVTTVLGLVPMATGVSVDFLKLELVIGSSSAQWWGPMAVAMIFGLTFATVLTLVMVPTLYSIYEDIRGMSTRLVARIGVVAALVFGLGLLLPSKAEAVTLDEAFAAAEQHNVQLAVASERTEQAAATRWQAFSAVMPRVIAGASYVVNQTEVTLDFTEGLADSGLPDAILESFQMDPITVQAKQAWSGSLTLAQPLFNGQALPGYLAAGRLQEAARHDEARTRQQIRQAVAQSYYGLLTATAAIGVAEEGADSAEHQLQLARRQVEVGMVERRVALQAELAVARAQRDVLQAREQLVAAQEAFHRLTGLPRDAGVEQPAMVQVPAELEAAVQEAVMQRRDLAAARERIAAAKRLRLASDMGWAPSIDFNFTEVYNQIPGFVPENFQWRIGLDFNWSLFDGGTRIHKSRELASQTRVAELLLADARQAVEEQVRTSWERLGRARQALASVHAEVALAEENLALAEASFQAGTATWIDVEQARVSLSASKFARIRETMSRDLAAIDLLVAVGAM
jgi:multidrug efflux pump